MEYSTGSTGHSNCFTMHSPHQSMLLKADTGADVNLMNRKNIQPTLWWSQGVATNSYQDGKLWKYCSESARDVPCISDVEGQGLQTVILCDRLWQIP